MTYVIFIILRYTNRKIKIVKVKSVKKVFRQKDTYYALIYETIRHNPSI